MISTIRDGISLCLSKAYPQCTIYGDARVQQGMKTPSFFVGMGECSQAPLPNKMLKLRQFVEVVYFPEQHGDLSESLDIGLEVATLLGELRLADGTVIRGTNCRCVIQDGAVHIQAVYYLRLRAVLARGMMQELFQKTII